MNLSVLESFGKEVLQYSVKSEVYGVLLNHVSDKKDFFAKPVDL